MGALLVTLLGLLSLDLHLARGAGSRGAQRAGAATCVKVATAAYYVPFGYNHIVTLASACSKDALCTVATDVAPEPQIVEVPRGQSVDVVTFMASPSQVFTARVSCALK